ncbi:MAG: enoyl-CoA hydratase/isomerase family protein [Desulfobacterales bacterium]|nr:enoyl-CoA hydratase/isomerase family protein [Desulfobacterales bacterium]
MERRNGILQMTLHDQGKSFRWCLEAQRELVQAFKDVGADRGNRLIILTGTGEVFSGPRSNGESVYAASGVGHTPMDQDKTHWHAKRLMTHLLDIEVPIIAAVNGPATRHCELPLLCDIVNGSDDSTFEDTAHFHLGNHVPGDGMNVILTMLLGINRARYMMLMGQVIDADEALRLGMISEKLPKDKVLSRAWEIAEQLATKPDLLLRYSRVVLTDPLKRMIDTSVQWHLAMETLATIDSHNAH